MTVVDRRQRRTEKKQKRREIKKQRARQLDARRPDLVTRLIASATKRPFGPCAISADWDDEDFASIVSLTVTRVLGDGTLLPCIVLVDRTCLGVKDCLLRDKIAPISLEKELDFLYQPHDCGWVSCDPIVAQSVLFHALDYAARLDFKPHPDFIPAFFEPRPSVLAETAWCNAPRPLYVPGPQDDVSSILIRLTLKLGSEGFDTVPVGALEGDFDEDDFDEDDFDEDDFDENELDDGGLDEDVIEVEPGDHGDNPAPVRFVRARR
jgi:hypothetical protein